MTPTLQERADEFLTQERIAVVGVSSKQKNAANYIYDKLKKTGHTVYAINPNATSIDGDPCYPDVKSTPLRPDTVVVVTRPEISEQVVHDCAEAGIKRVWLHSSFAHDGSSVSDAAVQYCHGRGIDVIAGGCPMMFEPPVDFAHKCIKWVMNVSGQLPR